jgi:ribosome-interacting GTPase 1
LTIPAKPLNCNQQKQTGQNKMNIQLQIKLANVVMTNNNLFTKREQLKMINEIPSDIRLTAKVDRLIKKHSAFDGIIDLVNAKGGYTPTLYTNAARTAQDREDLKLIANYYDALMNLNGSDKRAYRV